MDRWGTPAAHGDSRAAVAAAFDSDITALVRHRSESPIAANPVQLSSFAWAMIGSAVGSLRPTGPQLRSSPVTPASDPPTIDVLLPAPEEVGAIEQTLRAVRAADYPPDRLRLYVITGPDDTDTRAQLRPLSADDDLTVFRIPADYPGEPSTLRALNYGFSRTDGELVGVIDAADAIDPALFSEVAGVFDDRDCDFAIARLNQAREDNGWYNLLFRPENRFWYELVVPTVARAGYPVPLGGTPCFFRRAVLEEAAEARFERYGSPWSISERLWMVEQGYLDPVPWDPTDGTGDFELGLFLWEEGYAFEYLDHATLGESAAGPQPGGARGPPPTRPFLSRLWQTLRGRDGVADPTHRAADTPSGSLKHDPAGGGPAGDRPDTATPAMTGDTPAEPPAGPLAAEAVRPALQAGAAIAHQLDRTLVAAPGEPIHSPATADVATAFVREVEAGAVPRDVRDGLAAELRDLLAPFEDATPPPRVRLGSIEGRLRTAQGVADALEAALDRHGPADEFVAGVRADLESVETAVGTIRDDIAGQARWQQAIEAVLCGVEDDVDRLDRRLELVDARLDALEAADRSSVSAVRGDVAAVAGRLGRQGPLGDEVDALRDTVADVQGRHAALVDALLHADSEGRFT